MAGFVSRNESSDRLLGPKSTAHEYLSFPLLLSLTNEGSRFLSSLVDRGGIEPPSCATRGRLTASHISYHGLAALAPCRPGRQPPPQALGPSPRHEHQGSIARDGWDRRGGQVSGHVVTQDRLRRDLPSRTPRLERGPGRGVEPDAQHHLLRHPSRPLSTCGVNMLGRQRDAVSTWLPPLFRPLRGCPPADWTRGARPPRPSSSWAAASAARLRQALSTCGVNMLGRQRDGVSTWQIAAVPRRCPNGWFVRRRQPAARAGVRS